MLSLILTVASAIPHERTYGKDQAPIAGPASYSCQNGYFLDGKRCIQEFNEAVSYACPIGFHNAGTNKEFNCVQETEKIPDCPKGSMNAGKNCIMTEAVPAIPFCPPGYDQSGKGCKQLIQLPLVQKCDIGKLIGKQCLLEDRAALIVEHYCPAGYVEVAKGCQKTTLYDCTRPNQSKKGVGAAIGGVHGRSYRSTHYGNNYDGGYYRGARHLRRLGHKDDKKHDDYDIIQFSGKDYIPPPAIEVVSKQCERIEYARPEARSFCPPDYNQSGKGCVKLITSQPRQVCSNGSSSKNCTTEKYAPIQNQCPKGYSANGKKCTASRNVPVNYVCPTGFYDSGKNCVKATNALVSCAPGLTLRGKQCIGKRFAEPIVTQQITCVGKGCNEY